MTCSKVLVNETVFGPVPDVEFFSDLQEEVIAESARKLAEENIVQIDNATIMEGMFRPSNVVEFIFLVCQKLKLPYEAKYIAVETFSRFMYLHMAEIYKHVHNPITGKNYEWKTVENRVKSQVTLRALTCIQITSKLCSHYKIVSPQKIQNFLSQCGYKYTVNSMAQSEFRILKTLQYELTQKTPMTYVEMLLEILSSYDQCYKIKDIYTNSLKILDMYYINQKDILEKAVLISESQSLTNKLVLEERKNAIRADYMLIACAIIGTAAFVVDYKNSDKIIKDLSELSSIANDDLIEFSTLFVKEIVSES